MPNMADTHEEPGKNTGDFDDMAISDNNGHSPAEDATVQLTPMTIDHFGGLFDRQWRDVFQTAYRYAGSDRHLAEEVTQQAFIRLFNALRAGKNVVWLEQVGGLLHQYAMYEALSAIRTEKRRATIHRYFGEYNDPDRPELDYEEPRDEGFEDRLAETTDNRAVLRHLANIMPPEVLAYLWAKELGIDRKKMLEGLGLTNHVMDTRVWRARKALHEQYPDGPSTVFANNDNSEGAAGEFGQDAEDDFRKAVAAIVWMVTDEILTEAEFQIFAGGYIKSMTADELSRYYNLPAETIMDILLRGSLALATREAIQVDQDHG